MHWVTCLQYEATQKLRSLDSMSTQRMPDSLPSDPMASQSPTTPATSPPTSSMSLADVLSKCKDKEDAKFQAFEWLRDEGNDHDGGAGEAKHLLVGALKVIKDFEEIRDASKAADAQFDDVAARCEKAVNSMKGKVDEARLEKWKSEKLKGEQENVSMAKQAYNDAAAVLDGLMSKILACFEPDETMEDPTMVEMMDEMKMWLLEDEKTEQKGMEVDADGKGGKAPVAPAVGDADGKGTYSRMCDKGGQAPVAPTVGDADGKGAAGGMCEAGGQAPVAPTVRDADGKGATGGMCDKGGQAPVAPTVGGADAKVGVVGFEVQLPSHIYHFQTPLKHYFFVILMFLTTYWSIKWIRNSHLVCTPLINNIYI